MELTGNIILPDRILYGGRVVCRGGVIAQIVPGAVSGSADLPYIAPGFVDIHNHGALGRDYMEADEDAFATIADHLTRHGVTSAQCTTVSAPVAQLRAVLDTFRRYRNAAGGGRCRLTGVHLEGPYLSPAARGAHPADVLLIPERDGFGWVLENRDIVREVTVAPELAGMPEMIAALVSAGIVVSGGHDAAEPENIDAAAANGMTHCTHIYCAMSTLHKTNGQRRHGLCECAMASPDLTAEMIADNHHIPPLLARIIWRAKGADRVCLVSDAIAPAGLPESKELYRLGSGAGCTRVFVENGVAVVEDRSYYAGSIQALDRMVRNLVRNSGVPLTDAVRMASLTPARVIGIDADCGSIAPGKRADLCLLDARLQVVGTVIAGRTVYQKEDSLWND